MVYLPDYDSRICVAYVYERLHHALDSDDLALAISNLNNEMANSFYGDTGTKIGEALGWNGKNNDV
mgnify:FL=1|tara:strand:+ start:173 stop:370 length:198 start_codon:yes stop_codon:yes gene_type:complete